MTAFFFYFLIPLINTSALLWLCIWNSLWEWTLFMHSERITAKGLFHCTLLSSITPFQKLMDQGLQYFKETLSAKDFRARSSAFSLLPISMKRLHSHNQFDTQDSPNTWDDFRSLILLQLCIQQYKFSSILYKGQCIVELFLNRVRHNVASCRSFKNSVNLGIHSLLLWCTEGLNNTGK